jgi:hypothetical protein
MPQHQARNLVKVNHCFCLSCLSVQLESVHTGWPDKSARSHEPAAMKQIYLRGPGFQPARAWPANVPLSLKSDLT